MTLLGVGQDIPLVWGGDDGETDTGGLQFGSSLTDYDTGSPARAECATQATIVGFGIWAWSRVWETFEVTVGPSGTSRRAVFNVEGEYRGYQAALGASTSNLDVEIFIRDLSDNSELSNTKVMHSFAGGVAYLAKEDTFLESVACPIGEPLEAGKDYAVGVRAKATATADTLGSSSATFHPSGSHNGVVELETISVDWI